MAQGRARALLFALGAESCPIGCLFSPPFVFLVFPHAFVWVLPKSGRKSKGLNKGLSKGLLALPFASLALIGHAFF